MDYHISNPSLLRTAARDKEVESAYPYKVTLTFDLTTSFDKILVWLLKQDCDCMIGVPLILQENVSLVFWNSLAEWTQQDYPDFAEKTFEFRFKEKEQALLCRLAF